MDNLEDLIQPTQANHLDGQNQLSVRSATSRGRWTESEFYRVHVESKPCHTRSEREFRHGYLPILGARKKHVSSAGGYAWSTRLRVWTENVAYQR